MHTFDVVILAAGLGSRLNSESPKCLNSLPDGRSILQHQVGNVRAVWGASANMLVVTGFRCWEIMTHDPSLTFAYNERFAETNTNRSLLRALEVTSGRPLLWMNGDVVFDARVLERLVLAVEAGRSGVSVNTARVADEEVKYTVDEHGFIRDLSKQVPLSEALGEAVGVNAVTVADRKVLEKHLRACADQDYFERGLETGIAAGELRVAPVDVTDLYAVEVDTHEDLEHARAVYAAAGQGTASRKLAAVSDDSNAARVDSAATSS